MTQKALTGVQYPVRAALGSKPCQGSVILYPFLFSHPLFFPPSLLPSLLKVCIAIQPGTVIGEKFLPFLGRDNS